MKALQAFIKDEDGVASVEYALLLLLVVMTTLAAWQGFASRLVSGLNQATNAFAELNQEPVAP
jgi:Flp pilus assembly pilin Flp